MHQLSSMLAATFTAAAVQPVIGSQHMREQLSAALNTDVWQRSQNMLASARPCDAPHTADLVCPRCPEDAVDQLHAQCTFGLDALYEHGLGPEHALQSYCARHACCTALLQLSLSIQMQPSATQLQPHQDMAWSHLMALAQRHESTASALTCWPHIMPLVQAQQPLAVEAAFADADLQDVQTMLMQAHRQLSDQPQEGSSQMVLSHSLLSLALLQAWDVVYAAQSAPQPTPTQPHPAAKLAGLLPQLAELLLHVTEMTESYVMVALQQRLADVDQAEELREAVRTVVSLHLDHQQVSKSLFRMHQ